MNRIVEKARLSADVYRMSFEAPLIARERRAGQFLIVQLDVAAGERIPLTIADADPERGTITIVFQAVGATTHRLADMGPGGFGENLAVDGLDERTVCVGDVLTVGGATLQVSSPRGPCSAISRRWDDATLLARVSARRWTGWYLRVLVEGDVRAGDVIARTERPHPDWSIDRLLALRLQAPRDPADLAAARSIAAMSPEWHGHFARLASAASPNAR